MRLLLIFPSCVGSVRSPFHQVQGPGIGKKPPLGLLYIASHVRAHSGHQAEVLDLDARPMSDAQLRDRLRRMAPDVVGVTAWTELWYPVVRLAKLVKETLPGAHVVLGGPHVGIYPAQTLAAPGVDSIVLGDGEEPTLSLLNHLESGASPGPGLYLRGQDPGEFAFYVEKDLDRLPIPDRTLLPLGDYSSVLAKGSSVSTMITSRGCPFHCTYCKLNFQKTVYHGAHRVVEEMAAVAALGIRELEIYDDTFTMSADRLRAICEELAARRLPLSWSVRDRVNNVSRESLRLMRQAGCDRIHLGIESGSPEVLQAVRKRITLEQAREAVALAKEAGFTVLTYFMFGLPGEGPQEANATLQLALELDSDYAEFNVCIPYPGTVMYRDGLAKGIIPRDFWLDYALHPTPDFVIPHFYEERLNARELKELSTTALRKFYFRPRVLIREALSCVSPAHFLRKARMGASLLRQFLFKGEPA
jgi:radical SAM superfamily enzyme YgiQ (UPF0313 family)